jgi:flagellar motility protein MotE (MotC chaperone)
MASASSFSALLIVLFVFAGASSLAVEAVPVAFSRRCVTFTVRLGDFIYELATGTPAHLESAKALAEEPKKEEPKKDEKKEGEGKEGDKPASKEKAANDARQEIPAKSDKPASETTAKGVEQDPFESEYNDEEVKVLQSLSKRRDSLDQRERDIEQREKLLQAAEKKVDEKVTEMNKLKGQIENLLADQQKMQDERITQLVKIYENMKPKDAANIFNEMDFDVLLGIIDKMSTRKVAPVLAAMDPARAREISARIAEQKALPKAANPDAAK